MRVNILDIVKTHGASLDVRFNEVMPELNSLAEEYIFEGPVHFEGRLENFSGRLKLEGRLQAHYTAKCFRCLTAVECGMDIEIKDDFVEAGEDHDSEAYTYEGNFVELDKVFKDNIILNLPARHLCTEDCKGLCPQCGCDLNEKGCECEKENINPQLEVLKNFFK